MPQPTLSDVHVNTPLTNLSIAYRQSADMFVADQAYPRVQVLKQSFCEAVDDYLATCEAEGKKPDVPFKGTFNVRTGPDLHREAAIFAARHRMNLNSVVKAALQRYLSA